MINPFTQVNWSPGLAEKRRFALSLLLGSPLIACVVFVARGVMTGTWVPLLSYWIAGSGVALSLLLLAVPALTQPVYVIWFFLGCCIAFVVSNLLMATFYFTVVTGIGLVLRALGKNRIQHVTDKKAVTYWNDVERGTHVGRYYRQF